MKASWEQFETTGSVEDYLKYRQQEGFRSEASGEDRAVAAVFGPDGGYVFATEDQGGYMVVRRDDF